MAVQRQSSCLQHVLRAAAAAAALAAQAAADAEPPLSLTPMVSNSRKDQREGGGGAAMNADLELFDLSALRNRISVLEGSLSSLLTIAAFSDALLCKLICINAYSYFKAGAAAASSGTSEEIDSGNAAELLSATCMLSFGATLGRQLDWNLSKIKKKKKKDGNDSRQQQQQQLSVRLLSPFVVLCDLISQFYGGSSGPGGEPMTLPHRIRQGKYSSSKGCEEGIAAAFSKAQCDFWTQVAAVANTVRSMEAFTMLVNTTSASSNMDDNALRRFPLPKEYGDFRGFAPFAGVFTLYEAREAALGSGNDAYLSAEKAVAVLDLSHSQSQSQTQSQGSTPGQKPKEGNKSSVEAHARVLHFLLFLKRHTIAGAAALDQGQYLFEERGKLTSILDSSALNDVNEEDDDDNMAQLGSDNDENDLVDAAADDAGAADVEVSERTCASPSLAGGGGEGEGGTNLLVYKKGADSGPALLVPTMFGIGNSGAAAPVAASNAATGPTSATSTITTTAAAATDALRIPQPSAAMGTSTVNPMSSTASQPSLMTGISYPQQQQPQPQPQPQPQSRQGMDGVVLEGINQAQTQHQQGQFTSTGVPPPGFVSGAGAPPPPGMMQPGLFAPTNTGAVAGGLPSAGMFQGSSSALNTANPFVPMPMPMPSNNRTMNSVGGGSNLLFPPPQSSLTGGASTGFGIPGATSGGIGIGSGSGGDLTSSLLDHGGIFGSYDDILNLSLEHDDDKNPSDGNWGGGWTQRTNNPFATNIQ
mmetsp:Transcript_28618/g.82867  ORF Transcript_28618/g.82867 Transcript_28618/m.82867 type:complete len:757 (+) Transcript_28618:2496-4766(+)